MSIRSLLVVPLALLALPSRADAQQKHDYEPPKPVRLLEPDFDALLKIYEVQLDDWKGARVLADRAGKKDTPPPHPARAFWARFQALADRDSGGGLGWMLENVAEAIDAPAERARVARDLLARLLEKHAEEDSVLHGINGLKSIAADLGESGLMEAARSITEKSSNAEIQGQGMLLQAWARVERRGTPEPQRLADAREIWRSIVYTLPRTRAGKEAAGILYPSVEQAFQEKELAWLEKVLALQAVGRPQSEWPPQPIHEMNAEFLPLSQAGLHSASNFVGRMYPAYSQAENQGPGIGLSFLANLIAENYSDVREGPWTRFRIGLLGALYKEFPSGLWVFNSLRKIEPHAELLPADRVELALAPLLAYRPGPDADEKERARSERDRAAALFVLASSLRGRGDQRGYERAIAIYEQIKREFPEDPHAYQAEDGRSDLEPLMPGRPLPVVPLVDAEGIRFSVGDYKGHAVMLEFFMFNQDACVKAFPSRAALVKKMEGRPFRLIGVAVDTLTSIEFHKLASQHGVSWRTAPVDNSHEVVAACGARRWPTSILVDADGVIRARDLEWDEMLAMAEKLVAEAEAKAKAKGADKGPKK